MTIRTYEAGALVVNWFGVDLSTGWAEDTFLTITPLAAKVETTFGADGKAADSKLANRGATIELTLKQSSTTNFDIAAIAAAQDVIGADIPIAPFTVEDPHGGTRYWVALNARLTQGPTQTFGASMGEVTWMWTCENYYDTNDPETFTSLIRNYIRL